MRENVVEALGYGLVLGFLYFVWGPLPLAGGGLLLVVWANTRPARSGTPVARALGAALGAARQAWKAVHAAAEQAAGDQEQGDGASAAAAAPGGDGR